MYPISIVRIIYRGPHPNCTGSLSILLGRPVQLGCGPLYIVKKEGIFSTQNIKVCFPCCFLYSCFSGRTFSAISVSFCWPLRTASSIFSSFSRKIGKTMFLLQLNNITLWNLYIFSQNLPVDDYGSIEFHRWHAPYQKSAFSQPIKWHPTDEDIRNGLNNGKWRKNNPVSQPLRIVIFVRCF